MIRLHAPDAPDITHPNKQRPNGSMSTGPARVPSNMSAVSGGRSSARSARLWRRRRCLRGRRGSVDGQQRARDALGLGEGRPARGEGHRA